VQKRLLNNCLIEHSCTSHIQKLYLQPVEKASHFQANIQEHKINNIEDLLPANYKAKMTEERVQFTVGLRKSRL
jgi:hypothetical protein